jgi:hypothetical protein
MNGARQWSMAAFLRQVGNNENNLMWTPISLVGSGHKAVVAAEQKRNKTRHKSCMCTPTTTTANVWACGDHKSEEERQQPREENSPMCTNNNNDDDDDDFKFRIHKCTGPRELQNSHCAHQQHQQIFERHECAARETITTATTTTSEPLRLQQWEQQKQQNEKRRERGLRMCKVA